MAGWASLPLGYFSPPAVVERERTAEAAIAMRLFLGDVLSHAILDRIGSAWYHNGLPKDLFHFLFTGQAQWREGFRGECLALCRDSALHAMEEILNTTPHCASLHSLPKVAEQQTGAHEGQGKRKVSKP